MKNWFQALQRGVKYRVTLSGFLSILAGARSVNCGMPVIFGERGPTAPPILTSAVYFPIIPGRATIQETVELRFSRRGAHRQNNSLSRREARARGAAHGGEPHSPFGAQDDSEDALRASCNAVKFGIGAAGSMSQ